MGALRPLNPSFGREVLPLAVVCTSRIQAYRRWHTGAGIQAALRIEHHHIKGSRGGFA